MKLRDWLLPIESPPAVLLVRLATGGVFLSEGIQKFLFPASLGVGRFIRIGIPNPHFMAPFVGAVETICGAMLLLGLFTRLAALPLVIDIVVAILMTKFPYWLEHGFWAAAHESRTDVAMLCGSLFLLAVGPGPLSLDAFLFGRGLPAAAPHTSRG
jgi:putative oxidoreductase